MPKVELPIPLGFYQHQSRPVSSQRCINWIPTVMQQQALSQVSLIQRPGITEFTDTEEGVCRGGQSMDGTPFFVVGNELVSIDSIGNVTKHGAISGTERVAMANNGTSLVIVVPGGDAYVWDGTDLTEITDSDFQKSDSVSFYRGFFVFTSSDGKQLFVSNLNQPLVFDALDFGSAEGDPDRIVTQVLDHDELSILGERTTEVFRQVGGSGFPLAIVQGAFTEKGAHSKHGVVKFDNTYLFIGGGVNEQSSIWRQTSSAQASKISTDAIDNEIQRFTKEEIANCFAMTYSEKGQIFALFSFDSDRIPGRTFVFNGTASALAGSLVWFELQSGVTDAMWRANTIVKAHGKLLVGDSKSGKIGYLDSSNYSEYGSVMFRQATTAPFSQNNTTIFSGTLEATFESGIGLTGDVGAKFVAGVGTVPGPTHNPVARMDFSDDGGRTWSNEFSRSMGKLGVYEHRSVWYRQGRFPAARSIRITVTDPIVANLIKLSATPEIGTR